MQKFWLVLNDEPFLLPGRPPAKIVKYLTCGKSIDKKNGLWYIIYRKRKEDEL